MIVNVSVIITHNKKVLLMQRDINDKHFPGHWGIPGGGMEDVDTTIEEVAIREVQEEVGLNIIPEQIRFNNRYNDVIFIVVTSQLANKKEFSEKLNVSSEVYNYEWAGLDDLDDKKFTPFTKERIVEVLEEISNQDDN